MSKRQLQTPETGGKVDVIKPLLQYYKPQPIPDLPSEFFLVLQNNTDEKLEGWLTITPPKGWEIAPGSELMVAVKGQGTILAEFYLSLPTELEPGPYLLGMQITEQDNLLAEASFSVELEVES